MELPYDIFRSGLKSKVLMTVLILSGSSRSDIEFKSTVSSIKNFYLSTLYTTIPQEQLTYRLSGLPSTFICNKAIRDGKYLARHIPVLGNVHPIKIENVDIFCDVISLLARVFICLIDRATQEVPMDKYLKEIVCPVFEIYAIELLGSMST